MSPERMGSATDRFATDGYVGPISILTEHQCRTLANHFDTAPASTTHWGKDRVTNERLIFDLATAPALLEPVKELLGDDIVVWGASIVDREPGQSHPWHTDIESSAPVPGTVTAWLGLRNTSVESSLQLISGSHHIGLPLQQLLSEQGKKRAESTAEFAVEMATTHHADAELIVPEMTNGEAILFDGRLWHGSLNTRVSGSRKAILLHYATPDRDVRIPDWSHHWPFVLRDRPRPNVLAVSGTASESPNPVVAPPSRSDRVRAPLGTAVRSLRFPLARSAENQRRPHYLFAGSTPVQHHLEAHISVLEPGHSPHPPHAHLEEEILILLEGEGEVVLAESPEDPRPERQTLGVGDWMFYPSFQHHTIRSVGDSPVTYLMFRWSGMPLSAAGGLGTAFTPAQAHQHIRPRRKRHQHLVDSSTGILHKLHGHWSHVGLWGGYRRHADDYDVGLVLLSGWVITNRRVVRAPAVIFYPADALHGLRGLGLRSAEYLVFEWHGTRSADSLAAPAQVRATHVGREMAWRFDRLCNRLDPSTRHVGRQLVRLQTARRRANGSLGQLVKRRAANAKLGQTVRRRLGRLSGEKTPGQQTDPESYAVGSNPRRARTTS